MNDRQRQQSNYENKLLELIENQVRNDDNTLTQSDLQGAVGALISKIIDNSARLV